MRPYNGFTPEQRSRSCPWLRKEIAAGRYTPPTVCEVCGQTNGIIEPHTEDYSEPFGPHIYEFGLCYRCHMILHCRFSCPEAFEAYVRVLGTGRRFVGMAGRVWPAFSAQHLQGETTAPTEPADGPIAGFDHILARGREVMASRPSAPPPVAAPTPSVNRKTGQRYLW